MSWMTPREARQLDAWVTREPVWFPDDDDDVEDEQ